MSDTMHAATNATPDAASSPGTTSAEQGLADTHTDAVNVLGIEHDMDMIGGSLRVLSGLLGEAENWSFRPEDMGYLVWLIEEKARSTREAVLRQLYPARQDG